MDKRLGRGLSSLIGYSKKDEIMMISTDRISPSKFQPRRRIDEKSLRELAESIKAKGVIEPIIVRMGKNGLYEIVCGERRWRACKLIGVEKIPVVVKNLSDEEAFEISLIENIQREDLSPLEFALAFDKLVKMGYSHEDIAKKVGKSRSWVSNLMRTLKLPDKVKKLIDEGKISLGHAKVLCSIRDKNLLDDLVEKIVKDGISVREAEEFVKRMSSDVLEAVREKIAKKILDVFPRSDFKMKIRKDRKIEIRLILPLDACSDLIGQG